jgi:hypothetical protein
MSDWFTILLATEPLTRGEISAKLNGMRSIGIANTAQNGQMVQLQPRINSTSSSVATTETAIEPMQPNRLE